jgi:hypothetical protein
MRCQESTRVSNHWAMLSSSALSQHIGKFPSRTRLLGTAAHLYVVKDYLDGKSWDTAGPMRVPFFSDLWT